MKMRRVLKAVGAVLIAVVLLLAGPVLRLALDPNVNGAGDWRTATSTAVGLAPAPEEFEPAIVQVYAAPAFSWRGAFADHCWISAKPAGASEYTRYEVVGFGVSRNRPAIRTSMTANPDREWYGARPRLLRDVRGEEAEKIIAALPGAVSSYPYPNTYQVWPGPNSNTFIAHVARAIPDFGLALPGNALGKDYMGSKIVGFAPSGTGFQISLWGYFGVLLALQEGFELNILGLVMGINPMQLAITLPGIGRLPAQAG